MDTQERLTTELTRYALDKDILRIIVLGYWGRTKSDRAGVGASCQMALVPYPLHPCC